MSKQWCLYKQYWKARIDEAFTYDHYSAIPGHTQQAIERYVVHGVEPGEFLRACLCNDLFGAVGKADSSNKANLPAIAQFIYNRIPRECYGSSERVDAWIADGGLARQSDNVAQPVS